MFCRNCGNELMDGAIVCGRCGFAPGNGTSFCPHCGHPVMAGQAICLNCGFSLEPPKSDKSKLAAGLLGLFLGGYGVHNFYLGKHEAGSHSAAADDFHLRIGGYMGIC